MVGRGAPRILQQFHPAELLERGATPVGRGTHRFESAFALSAILVAQHPKFSGTIAAQSVRTKQPKPLVIDGFYRFFVRYGRPDQPINILNSLDLCLDNAHSLPIRASPDVTSREELIFITQ